MVISLSILKGTEKKMHATIIIGILKYVIIISAQQNRYMNMLASEKNPNYCGRNVGKVDLNSVMIL